MARTPLPVIELAVPTPVRVEGVIGAPLRVTVAEVRMVSAVPPEVEPVKAKVGEREVAPGGMV